VNVDKRDIFLGALDHADIGAMQVSKFTKAFLRESSRFALSADASSKLD
jgi:hypothetical protein